MVSAVELGVAYLSLVVESKGVPAQVRRSLDGVAVEGRKAGQQLGKQLSDAAAQAAKFDQLKKNAGVTQLKSAQATDALSAAQAKARGTSAALAIAEQRLVEVRGQAGVKSSQVMAAEERVARARQADQAAQAGVARAYQASTNAKNAAAAASGRLSVEQTRQAGAAGQLGAAQLKTVGAVNQLGAAQSNAARAVQGFASAQSGAVGAVNQLGAGQSRAASAAAVFGQAQMKAAQSGTALAAGQQQVISAFATDAAVKGKSADATNRFANETARVPASLNTVGGVLSRLGADMTGMTREADKGRAALAGLGGPAVTGAIGRASEMIKSGLVAGVAVGIGSSITSAVKLEATFSQTMNSVASATGAPAAKIESLRALAMKLGADTSFSAGEAADAMLELAKSGLSPATIEGGALAATLTQAAASGDGLGETANAIGNALNMFSLKGSQANEVAAAFAGGANASSAEVRDLTQGLQQVGPGAAAAGMSIQEVVGTLSAFNNAGVKGSDAGTSLKQMLASLSPSSKPAINALKNLGIITTDSAGKMRNAFFQSNGEMKSATEIAQILQNATKDLSDEQRVQALNTIFGADASRAANIMAKEGAAGLAKYIEATKNQAAAQDMANAKMSGTAGALELLSGGWETFRLAIGQAVAPLVQFASIGLGNILEGVGGQLRWIVPLIAAGAAALGLYAGTVKAVAVATKLWELWTKRAAIAQAVLNGIMALNPIGVAVVAVAALATGLYLLYQRSATFRQIVGGAWNAVASAASAAWGVISPILSSMGSYIASTIGPALANLGRSVGDAMQAVGGAVSRYVSEWRAAFAPVVPVLRAVGAGFVWLAQTVGSVIGQNLVNIVRAAVGGVVNVFRGLVDAIAGVINLLAEAIRGDWGAAWESLKQIAGGAARAVVGAVQIALSPLIGLVQTIGQRSGAALSESWRSVAAGASVAWSAVTSAVTGAWARMSSVFAKIVAWVTGQLTAGWRILQAAAQVAWSVITNAVTASWSRLLAIFTVLRTWSATTLTGAWNLLRSVAATAWAGITSAVSASWSRLVAIFTPLRTWATSTLTRAWSTLRTATSTAWSAITTAVSNAYSRLVSWFTPLRTWATSTLTRAFSTLRTTMSTVWSGITTTIGNAWSRINTSFTNLKNGVNSVWSFFRSAQRGIADVWSRLTSSVQRPINATRTWINSNLVSKMNSALGGIGVSLRVPALAKGGMWLGPGVTKAADGTVLPGYTPGRDVHRFWSPTGGRLELSGGEAIMVPEWTRALGPDLIRLMNSIARRGGVGAIRRFLFGDRYNGGGAGDTPNLGGSTAGFARGGIYAPAHRRFAGGGVLDTLKGIGGAVLDFFGNPFGAFVGLGKAILGDLPSSDGFAWGMARGFIPKVAEGVANKAKNLLASMFGGTGPVGNGTASGNVMGWQNQWNWLRNAMPGVRLHSSYRPGAITATGNRSYHSRGRAIDVTPSMAVFNRIKSAWGSRIAELIYSPAGGGQVWHGKPHYYTGITRAMHFNHVHWAMNRGGVFGPRPQPMLYDSGGLLRRGDIALHASAKPDRVLTDAQWRSVERYLPVGQPQQQQQRTPYEAGVTINGDVYGDPERFARKITTRWRDEIALVSLSGV